MLSMFLCFYLLNVKVAIKTEMPSRPVPLIINDSGQTVDSSGKNHCLQNVRIQICSKQCLESVPF